MAIASLRATESVSRIRANNAATRAESQGTGWPDASLAMASVRHSAPTAARAIIEDYLNTGIFEYRQDVPRIEVALDIAAPIDRCFDLARSVDVHIRSTAFTAERAVAGVTTGLMQLGDEVTWEARHLGVRQRLTARITAYDRPFHFRDSQVRGAFARFDHDHYFETLPDGRTRMRDVFDYTAPLGLLGILADRLFLMSYMRQFLLRRNHEIARLAACTS